MIPLRFAREYIYQLEHAGERMRLGLALTKIPMLTTLYWGETRYEVLRCWRSIRNDVDIASSCREELRRWRSQGRHADELPAMRCVAALLEDVSLRSEAAELHRERLELAHNLGDRDQEAGAHHALGWLLSRERKYEEAFAELERAYDLYLEMEDSAELAAVIGNMGHVYAHRGEYDRAIECYERYLSVGEELGRRLNVAAALGNIGFVYLLRKEYDHALGYFQRQYEISHALGDRRTLILALNRLGDVFLYRREYDRALEFYQRQLAIADELGDRSMVADAWGAMGVMYNDRQDYDLAIECFRQQLVEATTIDQAETIGLATGNMGIVYSHAGDPDRALMHLDQALVRHRDLTRLGSDLRDPIAYWLERRTAVLLDAATSDVLPHYLTQLLHDVPIEDWPAAALRLARTDAEECLSISRQLARSDMLVPAQVLLARITAADGRRENAIDALRALIDDSNEEQRADIHYWIWKFGGEGRDEACRLYRELAAQRSKQEYRWRIEELSGHA